MTEFENLNLLASNTVVLIDPFTKDAVDTITYDVLSKHVGVITDIRELREDSYKSNVVIFEPCLSVIVTPEILEELIAKFDITVHLVYQNDDAVVLYKTLCRLVKADYSEIGWNFIYAVVHNDLAILEPYQRSTKVIDGFKTVINRLPEDMQDYMRRFRGTYIALANSTVNLLDENAHLRETALAQEQIGRKTIAALSELKEILDHTEDKMNAYEALLSKSYDTPFGGFYPERPRVLYIKEISHVAGIDTFLSILFAVLNKQYKASCKVVKLVDSTNALHMRYVPNNYVRVTDPYNTSELLTNDFIVKLGACSIMFDTLLLNRSGLEYLIIHDMRGSMNDALDQTLVDVRLNEISADYAVLGEYNNVFSDLNSRVEFPWSFVECQKFTGSKSIRLANHPTIGLVLDLLF